MGASQSSNVSEAVTNLTNFVSNSTSANTSQVIDVETNVKIKNCNIQLQGDLNARSTAKLRQTNTQIVNAQQDANLRNSIQQQALQQAQSKVGFLGIGYADAQNSSSELVNSSNTITNDMKASASQYSSVFNKFICDNSTIIADNMDIGFYSDSDFLSSQTINNTQTARVVNNISQKVDQSAKATVEGLGALLIGFLAIIAVIVYGLGKPLSSGSAKVAVVGICGFLTVGSVVYMFLQNTPPFFAKPQNCINGSAVGMGTGADTYECVDHKTQSIRIESPPPRYIYPVLPGESGLFGPGPGGNLLQMAVAQAAGVNKSGAGANAGYRVDTALNLQGRIRSYDSLASKLGIANVPNLLYVPLSGKDDKPWYSIPEEFVAGSASSGNLSLCTPGTAQVGTDGDSTDFSSCAKTAPSALGGWRYNPSAWKDSNLFTDNPAQGIANLNIGEWREYTSDPKRDSFARFVLCDIVGGIDLHIYMKPDELVKYIGDDNKVMVGRASEMDPANVYVFHPMGSGGGTLSGQVGYINTRQYKYSGFMKRVGVWLLVGILLVGILLVFSRSSPSK